MRNNQYAEELTPWETYEITKLFQTDAGWALASCRENGQGEAGSGRKGGGGAEG